MASGNEANGCPRFVNMNAGLPQTFPPASAAREDRAPQKIILSGQTPEGEHILCLLLKRTYDIVPGGFCTRSESDKKIIPGDVHYGDPMNSTVKFESDLVPYKLATDVVLNARAYSPTRQPVRTLTASLIVGQHRKDLQIIGDRVCRYNSGGDPVFTDPQPFQTMELRYERAYGGVDIYSDRKVQCAYPRNYLGCGFVVRNTKKSIENLPLPNIQDHQDLLTPARLCAGEVKNWERQPIPQGFGWVHKTWRPRSSFAGIMPAERALHEELRKIYSGLIPPAQREMYEQTKLADMDFRFFNGASPGLVFQYLRGDEQIRTVNLCPEIECSFRLPADRPRLGLDIGTGLHESSVVLHTVMIRMEDKQVDLVWRTAVPYPGPDWLPELKKLDVMVDP